jgi:hypothetical protein
MPIKPPSKTFPANPAAPVPATLVLTGTVWGTNPGFENITVNSSLRLNCNVQGVVHAWPREVRASAPGGSDKIWTWSVVPRVTVAQAPQSAGKVRLTKTHIAVRMANAPLTGLPEKDNLCRI